MCDCHKHGYVSRREARDALRQHKSGGSSGGRIVVYPCPTTAHLWHLGHKPGRRTRAA